jgi:hypothetical protein
MVEGARELMSTRFQTTNALQAGTGEDSRTECRSREIGISENRPMTDRRNEVGVSQFGAIEVRTEQSRFREVGSAEADE